jgi:Ca2+/Na+ antiporter
MDFTKLWDKTYLFGPNPLDISRSDRIFFLVAIVFVVCGIISKVLAARQPSRSPRQHLLNRLYHLFLTSGFLVLLWVGARFENIPWIAAHVVVLLLFLIWLAWLLFIAKYFFKEYHIHQKLWKEEELKQKYLAKK